MSHIPQRKDKDCLNCGTIVQGNYCQNCGQENVVPHESFWHMVKHFLYDITHFDSKFFDSMKFLLLQPGFLPQEYIKGKRVRYLNPIKKYVFTSAVFFLVFFGFFKDGDVVKLNLSTELTSEQRAKYINRGEQELLKDTANEMWKEVLQRLKDTTKVLTEKDMVKYWDNVEFFNLSAKKYTNLKEYDSIQKAVPVAERDGWLQRTIQRKNLELKEKYRSDPGKGFNTLGNTFLHKLPYLLFVSLPLFALILKLLYIRRKNFYYADHAIFSVYHYIFSFILLLFVFGLDKLSTVTGLKVFDALTGLLFLSGGVYLYISMKRFYGQKHIKTFSKFLLLNLSGIIMLVVLFAAFILFSVFEI